MEKSKKLNYIDFLKGIACLFVVAIHLERKNLPDTFRLITSEMFHFAVPVLFTITSYLCFRSLITKKPKSVRDRLKWSLKRIVSLIPIYYLALLICILFREINILTTGYGEHFSIITVINRFLFLGGFFITDINDVIIGVEWYIGIVAILYFIFPFVYDKYNSFKQGFIIMIVGTIIGLFIHSLVTNFFVAHNIALTGYSIYEFFNKISYIFAGPVFYFLDKEESSKTKTSVGIVCFLIFVVLWNLEITKIVSYSFFNISILLLSCRVDLALKRFKIINFIGKNSLSYYLFHIILIKILNQLNIRFFSNEICNFVSLWLLIVVALLPISFVLSKYNSYLVDILNKKIK